MRMAVDELPGRTVVDATGRVVGDIDKLMVDASSWAVESLRVRLRRRAAEELGLGWSAFKHATIDIPTGLVMAAGDAVLLRAAIEDLAPLVRDERPHYENVAPAPAHH